MKHILKNTFILFTFVFFTEQAIAQAGIIPPKEFVLNNGQTVKLTDLKGKVILLDFWYRGCLPCLKATPDLITLQEEFRNDLVIIGINDSDNKEDISDYYAYKKNTCYFSKQKEKHPKSLTIAILDIYSFQLTFLYIYSFFRVFIHLKKQENLLKKKREKHL